MSFDHSSALESQPTNWRREDDPQYSDDPEFRRFTTELSDKLFSMTSNVTRLANQIALLGTKRETERVRERVRDLIDETSEGFKEIGEGLKRVSAWPDLGVCILQTQSGGIFHKTRLTTTAAIAKVYPRQTQSRIPGFPHRVPSPPTLRHRKAARLRIRGQGSYR